MNSIGGGRVELPSKIKSHEPLSTRTKAKGGILEPAKILKGLTGECRGYFFVCAAKG